MTICARSLKPIILSVLVFAPAFAGGVITQVTDGIDVKTGSQSHDDAGTVVIGSSNADFGGQNPGLTPSIYSWNAASGVPTLLWSFPAGVWTSDSGVSDDGAWVAFVTSEDLTGGNPSGVEQLFLRRTDGSETRQLTGTTQGDGAITKFALAGSGNRAAFMSSTNPLGTNPSHWSQVFIVDTDGTNLRQLTTALTTSALFDVSISDDGSRIVFSHAGDLTGGNADGSHEIFAVDADGANLRQLTSGAIVSSDPRLSGNGARITFSSTENFGGQNPFNDFRIWVVDWSGAGLAALPAGSATSPSITDDGQYIYYEGWDFQSREAIWRVRYDGTGTTKLTSLAYNEFSIWTQVSGDGSRVTFTAYDLPTLPNHGDQPTMVMDSTGGGLLQLAADDIDERGSPEMIPDGTRLVFNSSGNPLGTNPNRRQQIFTMRTGGTELAQITHLTDGDAWHLSFSDDAQKIAFLSDANPLGSNPNHHFAPFAIRTDGTQLTLLEAPGAGVIAPVIAGNGTYVVFQSFGVGYTGQLMRMTPTGASALQITNDGDTSYKNPRIDANGIYVVYSTQSGIWRVKTDNTGRQQIANYDARYPDVSGNGNRYVWVSNQDPLGTNSDGSAEIFSWDASTNSHRQLTSLPAGSAIGRIRISRDGAYVTFFTGAPIFGTGGVVPYRLHVASGTVERIGALGAALVDIGPHLGDFIAISSNGAKMAFATESDTVGDNADRSKELYVVDMTRIPALRVSGTSPTIVSWDADPHAAYYDIIRGDVANLAIAGSNVDLGPVICFGDDMGATNMSYDTYDPEAGKAYFYLVRGSSGPLAGPGSYGQSKSGLERVAGAGGCP